MTQISTNEIDIVRANSCNLWLITSFKSVLYVCNHLTKGFARQQIAKQKSCTGN